MDNKVGCWNCHRKTRIDKNRCEHCGSELVILDIHVKYDEKQTLKETASRVYIVLIADKVNRVYLDDVAAHRYAKDYEDHALMKTKVISRKLRMEYISWGRRHER